MRVSACVCVCVMAGRIKWGEGSAKDLDLSCLVLIPCRFLARSPLLISSSSSSPLTFSVSCWTAPIRGQGTLPAPWLKCPQPRPVAFCRVTLCARQTRQSVSTSPLAADVWPVSDVKDSRTCGQHIWRLLAHLARQFSGSIFPIREAFIDLAPPQMTLHGASCRPRRFRSQISLCGCQNLTNVLGLTLIHCTIYYTIY